MDGFEDVKLSWKGEDFIVPADKVFELIRRLEVILMNGGQTPAFLLLLGKAVPLATLCAGYAASLRFAGAKVSDQQVYLDVMENFRSGSADAAIFLQDASISMLSVLSPPFARDIVGGADSTPEK